jgi:hypothetical protein
MTEQTVGPIEDRYVDPPQIAPRSPMKVVSCSAYGVQVTILTGSDLLEQLPSPLIPAAPGEGSETIERVRFEFAETHSAEGQPLFVVAEDGTRIFASPDVKVAARVLESRIHLQVAALTSQAVFVHAGVVAWRGRALILPGPSHSGKSSLVASLIAAGATYYSDEYAVIDLEGRIHPFPRQLRLRRAIEQEPPAAPTASRVSSEALEPLQPAWVMSLRYRHDGVWNPKELTPGQTLLALLENTVAVRRQSELTLRTLGLAVQSAVGLQSERGEAGNAAQEIIRLMDAGDRCGEANKKALEEVNLNQLYEEIL